MNYLAHIFLAQPNVKSVCGNLMGDFMKGVKLDDQPAAIQRGILNHRLIDRFTDQHPVVISLKKHLSSRRRRFHGIIADVVFDHLLILHWHRFSDQDFPVFIQQSHDYMTAGRQFMPAEMQRVTGLMMDQGWLESYRSLDGVAAILDRMSKRIRFENHLHGAIEEVAPQISAYDSAFLQVFPELIEHVAHAGIETSPISPDSNTV